MQPKTRDIRKEKTQDAITRLEKRLLLSNDDIILTAKRFRSKINNDIEVTEQEVNNYKRDIKKQIQRMRDAHGIAKPKSQKATEKTS